MHGLLNKFSPAVAAPSSRVQLRSVDGRRDMRYYAYQPGTVSAQPLPVMVVVHGITINAREHARWFAPLAERLGVSLLAPVFDPVFYKDYQRLGRTGLGARADKALNLMLQDWSAAMGCEVNKINLFGFSGGGQFAHRYAFANPERINALVLAAPGWYTFPDSRYRYPYGTRASRRLPEVSFDAEALAHVDTCVLVGEKDCMRDSALRQTKRVDKQQGHDRIERGRNWIKALRKLASRADLDTRQKFELLKNCGHDFEQCMQHGDLGRKVMNFLYPDIGLSAQSMPASVSRVAQNNSIGSRAIE